jgi:hypothetical protein
MNSTILTIKVSTSDPGYLEWKNRKNKGVPKQSEIIVPEPITVIKNDKTNYSMTADGRQLMNVKLSDGLLMIYQPFGTEKKAVIIDEMFNKKYDNIAKKRCGWCTLNFTHLPVPLPYNVQKKNTRIQKIPGAPERSVITEDSFVCRGCYCSFNCAMAQAEISDESEKMTIKELLYSIYRMTSGDVKGTITPSPPKELLEDYGGILSEEDYIKLIGTKNNFTITYPHIVCVGSRVVRVKIYEQ